MRRRRRKETLSLSSFPSMTGHLLRPRKFFCPLIFCRHFPFQVKRVVTLCRKEKFYPEVERVTVRAKERICPGTTASSVAVPFFQLSTLSRPLFSIDRLF